MTAPGRHAAEVPRRHRRGLSTNTAAAQSSQQGTLIVSVLVPRARKDAALRHRAVRVRGRHAARSHARERSELFANTIATWIWSQGTLAASILALPMLTRLLNRDEFGLWTQLLSLSALAALADMGMSTVFLRRITDGAEADSTSILGSATAFYRLSSITLTAILLLACLIPRGLLSPYMSHTSMPTLAVLLVIAAIGINLLCQPYTLRLLAQGRMDVEQIFGAGPAVVGTLVSILAAYWFATALAVAIAYAAVEFAFDVGLVIVAYRHWPRSRVEPAGRRTPAWWGPMWYESSGVLVVAIVPQVSMAIGVAVAGHVVGPAAAAMYGLAWKVGSLIQRFFTPFTDSFFVSLCRAPAATRATVARLATQLSMMALAGGTAAAFVVVAAGAYGLHIVFGDGYGSGVSTVLVMVLTETIRSMYRPFFRKIQSENDVGSLRYWFAASLIAQVPLAIVASSRWSTVGAALAALACAAIFEAVPVARKLSIRRSEGTRGPLALRKAGAVICATCIVVLSAWGRQRLGAVAIAFTAIGAGTAGFLALRQITRYLATVRPATKIPLIPNSGR